MSLEQSELPKLSIAGTERSTTGTLRWREVTYNLKHLICFFSPLLGVTLLNHFLEVVVT